MRVLRWLACTLAAALPLAAAHAETPPVREADAIPREVAFGDGGRLPEVRIHYRTLGAPTRDAQGRIDNAVMIPTPPRRSGSRRWWICWRAARMRARPRLNGTGALQGRQSVASSRSCGSGVSTDETWLSAIAQRPPTLRISRVLMPYCGSTSRARW